MAYPNAAVFASTYALTASNYSSSGASSTLSTAVQSNNTSPIFWNGGNGLFIAGGTFSSGSVTLGYVDPIGNSQLLTNVTLSAPGSVSFALPVAQVFMSGGAVTTNRTIAVQALYYPTIIG